jgi:SAM-dependent MidA family methyltransferase
VDAAEYLRRRIEREGPLPFDRFVDIALYHPDGGFFARGRGAGRAGADFITSPQVGSLFGRCVARALDEWWRRLDEPDPFVVVEAGAGDGRLARDVQRAEPASLPALHYVLVERAEALREAQRDRLELEPPDEALGAFQRVVGEDQPVPAGGTGPLFTSLAEFPAGDFDGVVFANELLDNLPFGVARWDGARWQELLVGAAPSGGFEEILVPAQEVDAQRLHMLTDGVAVEAGARLPIARGIDEWFRQCGAVLRNGWCCVVDYAAPAAELLARGGWLRTYHGHARGVGPLEAVGAQDVTAEVASEQVHAAATRASFRPVADTTQADWLRTLGIEDLVAAGRDTWERGAARGDLEALAGRSVVNEAAALTDPAGLGTHRVFVFAHGSAGETSRASRSRYTA